MSGAKKKVTKKLSKTLTGLKSKKKYYVKVRAFKKNSTGNRVYGKWSVRKQLLLQAAEDSPDGLCRTGADERNNDSRNTTGPQNQFLSAGQDHNEIRDGRDF